ncbi:hypothetical protein KUH03_18195 [Sphingobacterium sp. E70]|uniref:hypothetical protein n=1 Tax=Sphingobacterium sp. E70 TaxID=2853439 RepID=UPI00211CDD9E|nr:hypothetical protein [Sphingobacterium sp. E70]ULT28340.1 hypothetical protein KUH03_18195 [Sphingobacterium sp. E70]
MAEVGQLLKLRVLLSLSKRADDSPALRIKERFAELLTNPSKFPLILDNRDNFQLQYNAINTYPLWPTDGVIIKKMCGIPWEQPTWIS